VKNAEATEEDLPAGVVFFLAIRISLYGGENIIELN
jgi:hypothetical protein